MQKLMNLSVQNLARYLHGRPVKIIAYFKQALLSAIGFVFFMTVTNLLSAQTSPCYFDENLQGMLNANSQLISKIEINEAAIQEMMNGNTQAIMNSTVYTIPVVFHVIHLGESVGTGSNISDAQLLQALDDLNYDFRDIGGTGKDVEIEFCLAQRAPDGSPSTGINRVNGYGIGDYESTGMTVGSNEAALKALSVWPNRDYLNIWVVSQILGGFGVPPPNGFATFPGSTASGLDGIVLRSDVTGIGSSSHVITHEAGHFLGLYHTFEGNDDSTCGTETNCHTQGDRICDTPAHLQPSGGCVTTGLACDGTTSIEEVAHNYMNYTNNDCRDRFTSEQVSRMRATLMILRKTLTYSIGCEPGCSTVVADFTGPSEMPIAVNQTFVNTSLGNSLSYNWLLDGGSWETTTNLDLILLAPGFHDVCLDATDSASCVNRKCDTVLVYNTCSFSDPCEKVLNGDFDAIDASSEVESFIHVCGWQVTESSPFYCICPGNNALGLLFHYGIKHNSPAYDFERVTTRNELDLTPKSICKISFDYLVAGGGIDSIFIFLSPDPYYDQQLVSDSNATSIVQINNLSADYSTQANNSCYNSSAVFHHHEEYFYYNGDEGAFLSITGKRSAMDSVNAYLFVDNISINCCPPAACIPEPEFTDTLIGCTATFTGTNSGDPGGYLWDFGDGSIDTGSVVTHQFLWGDTFTVCLTIWCPDLENTQTVCHRIIIPDSCNVCEELPGIRASRCDTSAAWVSSFCFQVPKGFRPCKDNGIFMSSPQVGISVLSYEISDYDAQYDQICMAIKLIPPTGYNFETSGATGYISLCSDGEIPMICKFVQIGPFVCDDCLTPISNTAICNDPNLNDNVRIYRGSIAVTLSTLNGMFYKAVSTKADFEVDEPNIVNSGANFTIPYKFTTTDHNLSNFQVILTFIDNGNGTRICVPVNITLPVCDTLPTNCGLEWSVKNMACTGSDGGNLVIFNFNMSVNVGNLELCNGGLFGTVDGGIVDVLTPSPTASGGVFTFNINMVIPCDSFVSGEVYNMRLYLCTEEGELECLFFPLRLFCDDCAEIGFRTQPVSSQKSKGLSEYWIAPNPAFDRINVFTTGFDPDKRQEVRLFDQLGRLVKTVNLLSEKTEIDISQCYSGIYYLVISTNGALIKSEKVIVIRQ